MPTVNRLAAPGPVPRISGKTPIIVEILVIRIGLSLIAAASNTATSKFFPPSLTDLQILQLGYRF